MLKHLLLSLLFFSALPAQSAVIFTLDSPTIKLVKPACYPGTYNPGGLHEFGDCYVAQGPSVSFSGTLENTGTEDFTVDTINAAFSMWGNTLSYTFTGSGPTVGGSMAWVGYTATIGGLGLHVPAGGSVGFIPFNVQFDPGTSYDRTGVETLTLTFAQSSPLVTTNSDSVTFGFVPEPATFVPMLASVTGAAIWHRRRRSYQS